MSEELEALYDIRDSIKSELQKPNSDYYIKKCNIIENALKDYERRLALAKEYNDVNNVAKRLKAFEVIKEKKINVKDLLKCDSVGKYNYRIYKEEEKITQLEFDLLKEVLL